MLARSFVGWMLESIDKLITKAMEAAQERAGAWWRGQSRTRLTLNANQPKYNYFGGTLGGDAPGKTRLQEEDAASAGRGAI